MRYGGPHVLPLQQQGIIQSYSAAEYRVSPPKSENCTSMINSQTAFAVPSQERDRGGARGEQQEEK